MTSARALFDGLGDRAWLNCAHQSPLPSAASAAAREAVDDKRSPWRIQDADFAAVPGRLRSALGRLIGAPPEEIILANSTSYGIDLLAHNLPWKPGDEVLLVDGDFPASVYPWLPLRDQGVRVRMLHPEGSRLTPEQLAAEVSPSMRPELLASLTYKPVYWLTHRLAQPGGVTRAPEYELAEVGAAAHDVFCTANFLNFRPWTASVELQLEWGIDRIAVLDQMLVDRLVDGLADGPFRVRSPLEQPVRSTLVFIGHEHEAENERLHERLRAAGVDVALRAGAVRISPHFYNDESDIDRALEVIRQ